MATEQTNISTSCYLPEEMIREILVRLPTKTLVRCRAVSKAWHRLATDRRLLVDHHSRQPTQPLIIMLVEMLRGNCLQAIDLATVKSRTILGLVDMVYHKHRDQLVDFFYALTVHGSCDGLVLLSYYGDFSVWNPVTRQCALLPSISRDDDDIAGFYRHAASGEYRVLYSKDLGLERDYYVLTLDSQQTRNIGRCPSRPWVYDSEGGVLFGTCVWPPVLLDGCLHCPPPHRYAGDILTFDTDAESFRCIPSPEAAEDNLYQLVEMEGKLAMFCWMKNTWISDLWIMEDYEKEIWVYKCRIELPPSMDMEYPWLEWIPPIVYKEGDMLVEGGWSFLLHYDKKGGLHGSLDCDTTRLNLTPHVFKESLVLHEFLQTQQNCVILPFSDGSTSFLVVFSRLSTTLSIVCSDSKWCIDETQINQLF